MSAPTTLQHKNFPRIIAFAMSAYLLWGTLSSSNDGMDREIPLAYTVKKEPPG